MMASKLAKSVRNIKEKMEEDKDSATPAQVKTIPETVADSKLASLKTNTLSNNNETTIRKIPANRVWPD